MQPEDFAEETKEPEQEVPGRLGIDLLLTRQVAEKEHVSVKTIERWIEKGLPAYKATKRQKLELFNLGMISAIPPHGVIYLIREGDLGLIPSIRAYPKGTTRSRRGKKTGAGDVQR